MPSQQNTSAPGSTLFERLTRSEERRVERQYGLTPASRRRRMRQIVHVLRTSGAFKGEMTPEKLRGLFEALGPTFVKVGQILSMRSEILPQDYCDELAKLRAQVEPMSYDEVTAALEAEYGAPVCEVFAEFDRRPLGSASVAQVHRARLLTGEDVAVKVQRPGVRKTMANDVDILRQLCRHLGFIWKSNQIMDLNQMVDELWNTIVEETNFLVEARNLREFRELNAHCVYIECPKPYEELCTEHVVVMDYVEGIGLDRPDEAELLAGYDLEEIGVKLVDNYATQVLDDGFFHADPHPANILVSGGKIVYIDLGMTVVAVRRTACCSRVWPPSSARWASRTVTPWQRGSVRSRCRTPPMSTVPSCSPTSTPSWESMAARASRTWIWGQMAFSRSSSRARTASSCPRWSR